MMTDAVESPIHPTIAAWDKPTGHNGFYYVGSPYSLYPDGLEASNAAICEQTALLLQHGIPAFSPIAHGHAVAKYGDLDPLDCEMWLRINKPMMDAPIGMIAVMLPSWERSVGLCFERKAFHDAGKPVILMTPGVVPWELTRG